VKESVRGEVGVVVAKTAMFTCSDATQQEMVKDIQDQKLDGLVVASCSPKLHLYTFREVARRAGLNPYQYTQVNVREQCSWAHTNQREGATEKATRLIRGAIARTGLTVPLDPIIIETIPKVLVVGAGISGLRAAVGLADLGIHVYLLEKSRSVGGWVNRLGKMYPHGREGNKLISQLISEVKGREKITLFTGAQLTGKSGSIGNFNVTIKTGEPESGSISVNVGSIIVATGFGAYQPRQDEYGSGMEGVLTLPEFKELLDSPDGKLMYNGREIKDVTYIYCVGSRQQPDVENANRYCSRYCCNSAVHASILAREKNPGIHQYHLYRDMRTYGKFELMYSQAREMGSLFLRFADDEPPVVERWPDGKLKVSLKDLLTYGEEIEIKTDLVVLVTAMVPAKNSELTNVLKLPVGRDKFYNEIHPKLRPVETVVDGVYICGSCQGPKNSLESVASAISAVSQSASILKRGFVNLDPLIASVDPDKCNGCGECVTTCPYSAIEMEQGSSPAAVNRALCKGCGGCSPLCALGAIELQGYTDAQIRSTIDALLKEI